MRWHYAVLVVLGVALLVVHGHPIERDEQTSLEESFADTEETIEDTSGKKKSNLDSALLEREEKQNEKEVVNNESRIEKLIDDISDSRSAENAERFSQNSIGESAAREIADKKDHVRMNDGEQTGDRKDTIETTQEEKKEEVAEPEEEEENEEKVNEQGEDDVSEDDVTKKDDIDKTKEVKEKRDKKVQEKASTRAAKKHEDSSKKWWMVEGAHKWGGMGHSHWGPPHKTETETEHHDEGHFEGPDGETKERKGKVGHVASCCKTKSKNLRKRCSCPHHEEKKEIDHPKGVKEHESGYHFHDKGGARSHNNDHDHELRGPWSFGYDGFGDDWGDWDHNHGQFDHLKDLEHESHGGHHEEVNEHEHEADKAAKEEDCGAKRDCVGPPVVAADDDGIDAPLAPPLGAAVAVAPLPGSAYAMPVPVLPPPVAQGHALPYRICHACHVLPDGGSRCLCKSVHPHHRLHRPHHANTHFNHHVYVDCDAAVHNFPANGQRCRARHDIPTPEHSKTTSGGNV